MDYLFWTILEIKLYIYQDQNLFYFTFPQILTSQHCLKGGGGGDVHDIHIFKERILCIRDRVKKALTIFKSLKQWMTGGIQYIDANFKFVIKFYNKLLFKVKLWGKTWFHSIPQFPITYLYTL